MKKWLIISFVMAILVAMMSWFVYLRHKLYHFLKEHNDMDSFHSFCRWIEQGFSNYFFAFYQYPKSSEDSVFRLPQYAAYGRLPYIYAHGVFLREDTISINDSIVSAMKLFLKGPNHNEKNIGQIINPIDYKN